MINLKKIIFLSAILLSVGLNVITAQAVNVYISKNNIVKNNEISDKKNRMNVSDLEIKKIYKDWENTCSSEILCENINILATVISEAVYVHEEKDIHSNIIYITSKNTDLMVTSIDKENWIEVNIEGKQGYVLSEFVDLSFHINEAECDEYYTIYEAYETDEETKLLLAAVVHCEARGESYEGQLAVASVVLNRVRSDKYPDTIEKVLRAKNQFSTVMSGNVDKVYQSGKINESCIKATEEALSGVSNVGDLTCFRRNDGREGLVIGNHVFHDYKTSKTEK